MAVFRLWPGGGPAGTVCNFIDLVADRPITRRVRKTGAEPLRSSVVGRSIQAAAGSSLSPSGIVQRLPCYIAIVFHDVMSDSVSQIYFFPHWRFPL